MRTTARKRRNFDEAFGYIIFEETPKYCNEGFTLRLDSQPPSSIVKEEPKPRRLTFEQSFINITKELDVAVDLDVTVDLDDLEVIEIAASEFLAADSKTTSQIHQPRRKKAKVLLPPEHKFGLVYRLVPTRHTKVFKLVACKVSKRNRKLSKGDIKLQEQFGTTDDQ
jgi:hypothetical protein